MITYRCPRCGAQFSTPNPVSTAHCPNCGADFNTQQQQQGYQQQQYGYQQPPQQPSNDLFTPGPSGKSRGVAGLLAILVGTLGIHYFYLGKTTMGIVFLLISLLSCGILATVIAVVSIIQGIIMLTIAQAEFERRYVMPEHPLF